MTFEPPLIRLLGQVRVQTSASVASHRVPGGRRGVIVLARMTVDAGQPVGIEDLAATIWQDDRPTAWKASLRNVIAQLRFWLHDLGPVATIVASASGYQLDLAADAKVDIDLLMTTAVRAEAVLAAGRDADALELVDSTLLDVQSRFLTGLDVAWVLDTRRRVDEAVSSLFTTGATAALNLGQAARAEVLASRAIERDEVREDGHRLLIRALAASGNRGAALQAYHRCRTLLVAELGSEPSATTQAVFHELLAEDVAAPAHLDPAPRPPLSMQAAAPLVGRRAELDRVEALLDGIRDTGPLVVRVQGESGIGKTRFAAEMAARAHLRGIPSLYGRAEDRFDLPHQPLLEAIDTHLAQLDAARRSDLLGPHAGRLAALVPSIRDLVPAEPSSGIPDLDLRHLAAAVGEVLAAIAAPRCALLILDDMQWGSQSTRDLVERLGESTDGAALLVLVLQRAGSGAGPEGADHVISLAGLNVDDVQALMSIVDSAPPDREVALAVWTDTGGNPLFVTEILRAGEADDLGGSGPQLTERLGQLVRRRVGTLARSTRAWLDIAAVAGLEFEPELVQVAGRLSLRAAADELATVEAEGLVTAAANGTARRAFRHALVRQFLLDDLERDSTYVMTIHDRLGAALESHSDASVPRLAHHASAAAPLGDWRRTARYGLAAARAAAQALVHDDVIGICRRTLTALADAGDPDAETRIRLTVMLGTAQRGRHDATGEATLDSAFAQAIDLGFPKLAAEAALGFTSAGAAGDELAMDTRRAAMYEQALGALGDGTDQLRAQLLGRLSTATGWLRDGETGRRYAEQALVLARGLGDLATLSTVLVSTRRGLSGTGQATRERAIEDELLSIAATLDDPGMATSAWLWRFESAIELGRGAELETSLAQAAIGVVELGVPSYRYTAAYSEAARLLLRGDVGAAEHAVEQAFQLGVNLGIDPTVAGGIRMIQLMGVRHEQGRLGEVRDELAEYFGRSGVPEWEGAVAFADCELGRLDSADGYLDKVFAGYAAGGVRTGVGIGFAAHMAHPVARIGDVARARVLYDLLLPYRGLGTYISYFTGPVDHALGLLARTLGRGEDAQRHLSDATDLCTALGAPRWAARCSALMQPEVVLPLSS